MAYHLKLIMARQNLQGAMHSSEEISELCWRNKEREMGADEMVLPRMDEVPGY